MNGRSIAKWTPRGTRKSSGPSLAGYARNVASTQRRMIKSMIICGTNTMNEPRFTCTSCGACCRRVWGTKDFPYALNAMGACEKLDTKTNLCTIYDLRPDICKVDKQYEATDKTLTRKEYYRLNNQICNKWIKEDNMPKRFLIKV